MGRHGLEMVLKWHLVITLSYLMGILALIRVRVRVRVGVRIRLGARVGDQADYASPKSLG